MRTHNAVGTIQDRHGMVDTPKEVGVLPRYSEHRIQRELLGMFCNSECNRNKIGSAGYHKRVFSERHQPQKKRHYQDTE